VNDANSCMFYDILANSFRRTLLSPFIVTATLGFFYWISEAQAHDREGWNYLNELHKFVDNGMEGDGFINAVSGFVNRVSASISYNFLLISFINLTLTDILSNQPYLIDRDTIIQ